MSILIAIGWDLNVKACLEINQQAVLLVHRYQGLNKLQALAFIRFLHIMFQLLGIETSQDLRFLGDYSLERTFRVLLLT